MLGRSLDTLKDGATIVQALSCLYIWIINLYDNIMLFNSVIIKKMVITTITRLFWNFGSPTPAALRHWNIVSLLSKSPPQADPNIFGILGGIGPSNAAVENLVEVAVPFGNYARDFLKYKVMGNIEQGDFEEWWGTDGVGTIPGVKKAISNDSENPTLDISLLTGEGDQAAALIVVDASTGGKRLNTLFKDWLIWKLKNDFTTAKGGADPSKFKDKDFARFTYFQEEYKQVFGYDFPTEYQEVYTALAEEYPNWAVQ